MVRRAYDWAAIMRAARNRPGVWLRHADLLDVPHRTVARIRGRGHPDLRDDRGVLEARPVNEYTDEMGAKRTDIWVRFVPHHRVDSPHQGAEQGETP